MKLYTFLVCLLMACSSPSDTSDPVDPTSGTVIKKDRDHSCEDTCGYRNNKFLVCHAPPGNTDNKQTICVRSNLVPSHLAHGDSCGTCPPPTPGCECGDGSCDAPEDCSSCPSDCGECAPECGDGECSQGECCTNCEDDCGACPPTCGDGYCERGETCTNCSDDCGYCPPPCGNGTCDPGEYCDDCPEDCGTCVPECGDEVCTEGEDCANCPEDCEPCAPRCGDGECDTGETCDNCPGDCGSCPLPPDAGVPLVDAGIPAVDAGSNTDTGLPPKPPTPPEKISVTGGGCNSSSGDASLGFLLVFSLFGGLFFTRRKLLPFLTILPIVAALAYPTSAQVSGDPAPIPTERFEVPMDVSSIINVEGADTAPSGSWGLYAWIGYANDSLVFRRNGDRVGSLVGDSLNGSVGGFYSLTDEVQLHLDLPASLYMGRGLDGTPSIASQQVGDPRLGAKWGVFRQDNHVVDVALGFSLTLPYATGDYLGENDATFTPYLSVARWFGSWRATGNVGFRLRGPARIVDLKVDDELLTKVGVAYGWNGNSEVGASLALSTSATGAFDFGNRDYSEVMVGYNRYYNNGLSSFVYAGAGLNEGFGAPDWRVLAGIRWSNIKEDPYIPPRVPVTKEPEPEPDKKKKRRVMVLTVTDAYFAFDSAKINSTYKAELARVGNKIGNFLRANPKVVLSLIVRGHTDSIGTVPYNRKLGYRRATAVATALMQSWDGVADASIEVESAGETKPIASNKTQAGRAKNRRVEVYFDDVPEGVSTKKLESAPDGTTEDSFGNLKRQ